MKILTVNNKKEEKFLRQKTAEFDFVKFSKKQIKKIIADMKSTMEKASGIGLSANQIGLNLRLFVAQIPITQINADTPTQIKAHISVNPRSNPRESALGKFYAVFNPEIKKVSKEKTIMEEGCLSVPEVFGEVERPEKITLNGSDKNGKKIELEAEGLLARVFQHETDHLNGILFIDRCKKVYVIEKSEIRNPKSLPSQIFSENLGGQANPNG